MTRSGQVESHLESGLSSTPEKFPSKSRRSSIQQEPSLMSEAVKPKAS